MTPGEVDADIELVYADYPKDKHDKLYDFIAPYKPGYIPEGLKDIPGVKVDGV